MANNKNLEKGKATQFKSGEQAAKAGRKGGIASGEAKRKNKSLRDAAQVYALGQYKTDDGRELTGNELIIDALFKKAINPDDKDCISAIRLWMTITREDVTAEQMKLFEKKMEQMDADIEYRKKATKELEWR